MGGKHGRKEILDIQSNQIVKRRRRQNHLDEFVNWTNHLRKCYPNLIQWDQNQIKSQVKQQQQYIPVLLLSIVSKYELLGMPTLVYL